MSQLMLINSSLSCLVDLLLSLFFLSKVLVSNWTESLEMYVYYWLFFVSTVFMENYAIIYLSYTLLKMWKITENLLLPLCRCNAN